MNELLTDIISYSRERSGTWTRQNDDVVTIISDITNVKSYMFFYVKPKSSPKIESIPAIKKPVIKKPDIKKPAIKTCSTVKSLQYLGRVKSFLLRCPLECFVRWSTS
ncbi:uncharacterized protein LOC134814010 [Bolinopsis microptera]|uniref:uncharacterized protein LOC134814010 n=1 Tax=Bolinopsis microptera TaxID=2820187 RepID=UPI003079A38B